MTSGNMNYSLTNDRSAQDSLTGTIAAAVSSGIVGATIGQALSGRMGATVGAIVGGLAGMTFVKDTDSNILRLSARVSKKAMKQVKSASKHLTTSTDESIDSFKHQSERVTLLHSEGETPALDEVVIPTEAHNQLGVFLGRHGDLDEAIREFQVALDRQPNSAVAHYNLGIALYKQGKRTQGIEHLRQAKRLCLRQGKRQGKKAVEYALRQLQTKSRRDMQPSIG